MNFTDYVIFVQSTVRSFACSQGMYERLARDLDENSLWEDFARAAQENGVADEVDLVMWIEG